jgi:alpha,alpha-trehalase
MVRLSRDVNLELSQEMDQMLDKYIAASNDTAILNRALPLAEACCHSALSLPVTDSIPQRELAWWSNNRSLDVTSPHTKKTFTLFRYAVSNSAPRPESYLTGISRDCSFTVHPLNSLYPRLRNGQRPNAQHSE